MDEWIHDGWMDGWMDGVLKWSIQFTYLDSKTAWSLSFIKSCSRCLAFSCNWCTLFSRLAINPTLSSHCPFNLLDREGKMKIHTYIQTDRQTYIQTDRHRDRQRETDRWYLYFSFHFFSFSLLSYICCSHIIFCSVIISSCSLRSCLHDCSCSKSLCSTSSLLNQSDWFDESSAFNADISYQHNTIMDIITIYIYITVIEWSYDKKQTNTLNTTVSIHSLNDNSIWCLHLIKWYIF